MSELPTTVAPGDLDPDVCYADPQKDYLAHQHPRNAAEEQELEADKRALEARGPYMPQDQTTMGPADGIPYVPGERGESDEMPHDPFADEENERRRREAE